MTILRGRRSEQPHLSFFIYSSSRTSNRQTNSSIRLSIRQKNFLHKLVNVLSEVVDEDDLSDDTALETIETGGIRHVKTLLNTLGEGDRAAKTLEKMKEVLFMVDSSFYQAFYGIDMFLIIDAFDEFDIFSTESFCPPFYSRETASSLDRESREEDCIVDEYLDAVFRPNTNNPTITRIRQPTVLEPYHCNHNRNISVQCHSNDAAYHRRRPCLRSDYNHELALASFACFQFCIGCIQPSGDAMATVAYSPSRSLTAVPGT
ncbi:hypothetical protein ACEPAH_7055 [Sanghuangporus vaninii]